MSKPHLEFRYKARASIVARNAERFLDTEAALSVLDLGCAEGLTLIDMCNLLPVREAIGVEYSDDILRLAPPLPENITLLRGDVNKLPERIPSSYFDLVSALAILEHVRDPIQVASEALRVLRPGGLFIATSPRPFWDNLSSRLGLHRGEDHRVELGRSLLVETLERAGFEVVDYTRFMFAPVAFVPYLKIAVSPSLAQRFDDAVRVLRVLDGFFVNQCIVGRKQV
ncbi:MAG TPA: class I SAM-dependent methyltransferase [Thermoguttaceae bacterium]|nr:class I SAM-dependent methyltransferase [Thermoguttaceae bacterium]